jgi:hypothetical protein
MLRHLQQLDQKLGAQFAYQRLDHGGMGQALGVAHHAAAAVSGLDQAHLLQPGQPLSQRGAVDIELLSQLPLGGQGRAGWEDAVEDGVGDRRGDLFVHPLAIRRLQRT